MAKRPDHLDHLLKAWPYEFGEVAARQVEGADGRELIQLRIDLGMLQMEVAGRPDGWKPDGFDTYYDLLIAASFEEGDEFRLTTERRLEIDREFVQFYHRRIGWLALRDFRRAVLDADHTLALMDFSTAHSPDPDWAELHEQYRPFVLFHRTQAAAFAQIDELDPEAAVATIDSGLSRMLRVLSDQEEPAEGLAEEEAAVEPFEVGDEFYDDDLVQKLVELKRVLSDRYEIEPPLQEQLEKAIASEEYELAAKIRDRMTRGPRRKM